MARPTLRKGGPLTATERQQRWRANLKKRQAAEQRLAKGAAKRESRAARESRLAESTIAAARNLGANLYGVILCDPPWRFEVWNRETGMDRAADNHYPTMTIAQLRDLKLPAADNCALFLWATIPMLAEAVKLMELWGFTYKSAQLWDKQRLGTGYWYRNSVEILLLGTRGEVPAPAPGQQPPQLRAIPAGEHSAKPDSFAADIGAMFPTLPKLEMFARGPGRAGWDAWGNEAT